MRFDETGKYPQSGGVDGGCAIRYADFRLRTDGDDFPGADEDGSVVDRVAGDGYDVSSGDRKSFCDARIRCQGCSSGGGGSSRASGPETGSDPVAVHVDVTWKCAG